MKYLIKQLKLIPKLRSSQLLVLVKWMLIVGKKEGQIRKKNFLSFQKKYKAKLANN